MKRIPLLAALCALLLLPACDTGSRPPRIGHPAKDFTIQDSDRKVTLDQFKGQIVVLNFWATWCPPCVEELPSLEIMQERMRSRGLVVLGVSIDVDENAYHHFVKERGVNFVTVRDPQEKVAQLYGTSGWPETYIIDRQGIVRRKFIGAVEWNSPDILEFLSRL